MNDHAVESKKYNLAKDFQKSSFWGITDGDIVFEYLINNIQKSKNRIINLNLKGVKNFDPLFAEKVFIHLTSYIYNQYKGNRALILSDLSSGEIDYYIDSTFKNKRMFIIVEDENSYSIKGSASYNSAVIFHKLLEYSPIVPKYVCKEIGGDKTQCKNIFFQFHKAGLVKITNKGLYTSTIRYKSKRSSIRSFFKGIKLYFIKKPFIHYLPPKNLHINGKRN